MTITIPDETLGDLPSPQGPATRRYHPQEVAMIRIAASVLAVLAAFPAIAHTGGAIGAGLASGLAHPFSGLDHLLAMIA